MAAEPELPDLTPGEAPPPAQPVASGAPSLMQTILATVVVTVMAGGMGALFAVPAPSVPTTFSSRFKRSKSATR